MWQDLAVAICLMLILEGMLPFLAPARWRNLVIKLSKVDDATIRITGLVSMLIGVGLLHWVRQ